MQFLHLTSKQSVDLILIKRADVDSVAIFMQFLVIFIEVDIRSSVGNEAHAVLVDQLSPEELVIACIARIQVSVNYALLHWTVTSLFGLEKAHSIEIEG